MIRVILKGLPAWKKHISSNDINNEPLLNNFGRILRLAIWSTILTKCSKKTEISVITKDGNTLHHRCCINAPHSNCFVVRRPFLLTHRRKNLWLWGGLAYLGRSCHSSTMSPTFTAIHANFTSLSSGILLIACPFDFLAFWGAEAGTSYYMDGTFVCFYLPSVDASKTMPALHKFRFH